MRCFLEEMRQNRVSCVQSGRLHWLEHRLIKGFSEALVFGRQIGQERKEEALPKLRSVIHFNTDRGILAKHGLM